ncbi:hypothetical protein MHY85_14715 [Cellulomonas sp. ACRRI]|uniref:hypothetical protein n=1 Tax=Cellulomonas sp. ACRRI TaxID=2918188 RepID=UPI001EF24C64|nr:hypothetical protein [Cellulomonas sp. ACRRI]MCG7287217.1 hypothetical protein [Cellulomonas sp. ACRRI]
MTVQATGAPLTRVAVHLGTRRLDVALDAGRTLGELLAAAGVPLVPGMLALDSAGRVLDLAAPVAAQVADGAVVHVVAPAPRPRGRAARARAGWVARRPDPQPALLGAAAAAAGVLAAVALIDPVARGWLALAAAVLLGVAAVALAVVPVASATAATLAAPVLAFAAGVAAVDPAGSADRRLALVAGLVSATAVAAVRWVATRAERRGQDVAGVLVVAVGVVAGLALAVLLAGLPGVVAAAVLLGLTPVGLRAIPVMALSVPDEQLVDLAHVARTAPSVRGPRPRGLGRVNERQVVRTVDSAERRTDAGVLLVCALPPVLVPLVLVAALGDPQRATLRGWAAVALVAALVAVLSLQPRAARGPVARWAPRVAAALVLVELAALGAPRLGPDAVLLAAGCLVVALAAAAIGVALGRGWQSVVASRFADAVEGLGVVLALPAALVAADLIETLRRVTS